MVIRKFWSGPFLWPRPICREPRAQLPDNSRISTQWTRRMNSLKLWLTLRVHRRKGYEELIDHQLKLARSFAGWVDSSEDFELAVPQTRPIVTLRLKAGGLNPVQLAAATATIVEEVTRDGSRWISDTVVRGQSAMRMMVVSYLTEDRHLPGLETALTNAANGRISKVETGGLRRERG
jgi:aromatic-L-amino-acid decarboxylase